mgnify:CR=1 FL=1
MVFSNLIFLFAFLPLCLIAHAMCTTNRQRNYVLLAFSLFFYGWGEPIWIIQMLLSGFLVWYLGKGIAHTDDSRKRKKYLTGAVIAALVPLFIFKYAGFFMNQFAALFGSDWTAPHIHMPIGISFYTFQVLTYAIDLYRGDAPYQKSILDFWLYEAFFPQLIAGPIVRYSDIAHQMQHRKIKLRTVMVGIQRFIAGLAKKVLIANYAAQIVAETLDNSEMLPRIGGLQALLGIVAFAIQIYFDFSGYSDMAIGLGHMFGFHFKENFNYPYVSTSITEFWRRWHISLSGFFRDYVYIPLGGNRVSAPRRIFNIAVVWLLTGLWHGAGWTFILWGAGFAVLLILEKLGLLKRLDQAPAVLRHCYMLFIVVISFVLFDAPDLQVAGARIGAMFGGGALPLADTLSLYYLRSYGLLLILAAVGSTPVVKRIFARLKDAAHSDKILTAAEPVMNIALLLIVSGYLLDASFNPFLYFRF